MNCSMNDATRAVAAGNEPAVCARIAPIACALFVGALIVSARPAFAQSTVFRTRSSASSTWGGLLPLSVGIGGEYEKSDDEKASGIPMLVEYNFSQRFRAAAEVSFAFVDSSDPDTGKAHGFDDLETSAEYEFLRERRNTPALTVAGLIKWPTATNDRIGNPGTDYSIGVIASKDLVYLDLDANAVYTRSGDRNSPDLVELSLSGAVPVNYRFDLVAEVVRTVGASGPDPSSADETEATVGFEWQITPFQSLEQGFLRKQDGTWGVLVGWKYSFGGE